jgi:hypothetical protein
MRALDSVIADDAKLCNGVLDVINCADAGAAITSTRAATAIGPEAAMVPEEKSLVPNE